VIILKIGFIGAGNVGKAFGKYLKINGLNVIGYYSRTYNSSVDAAKLTKTKSFFTIEEISRESDLVFITTSDDEIKNVLNKLIKTNSIRNGQILVHMSGATSSKILESSKAIGCFIYSLHPLQSFANVDKAVNDLKNTYFTLEGDEEKISVIESIIERTNNKYFLLNSDQKSLYHITACVVSNYLVTLIDYGLDIFKEIGIDEKEGYKALYPLIDGTIKNIGELGTKKALTGPIARGDTNTIKNHISSLMKLNDKIDLYSLIGLKTLEIAKQNNLSEERYKELSKIFKEVL